MKMKASYERRELYIAHMGGAEDNQDRPQPRLVVKASVFFNAL